MKLLYIVFVTVILSRCNCEDVRMMCPGENVSAFDFTCTGRSDCDWEPRNFTWMNLNQDTGKVTLQFRAFDRLCKGDYYFILQAFENVTKDECKGIVFGHSHVAEDECGVLASAHSVRKGRVKEGNLSNNIFPNCEKTLNITFNLIYRGCYRLQIEKEYNGEVQMFCSSPVFLDTKFTKENIFKRNDLIIISAYNSKLNRMEHTVSGISGMHVSLMELTAGACQPEESCDACTTNGILNVWLMGHNLAGEFKCMKGNTSSNCSLIGGNEIKCVTENVDNRPQCMWVKLYSHPCRGNGVWHNTAINNHNHWCQWNSPPVLPQVLLLYPRDCEPFMKLMVTLRNMLREVMKCKVYDCFDHTLAEEIATGAAEWLNRHLECDNMKIVVIESECAVLHQKALFQGIRVFYQNPAWLDDIFIHGLKELANDKRSNQYNRFFVVCVHGFTDENNGLSIITSNTRYVIPQHIKELMTSLYRQPDLEYTEHLHAILKDIQALAEYKVNNMDYMNQLLIRAD
ncbi:uncharacterized protein LOC110839601 isoform X3 [Zootermopsis nevadensis]|uniref:uncharacterized protein LOC110839601 isoform X3 n=1 Tax=Zootermopsis nevadensis TaxID=136037 RepID=UPI000B8EA493|nr:uncharacterized protein LOC110839601 isoform X3 [Zootermopsis nevadensis]